MEYAATLIAAPSGAMLDAPLVDACARALPAGARPDWLAPGIACDFLFAAHEGQAGALTARLREALRGAPVDVAVQPAAGRRKGLLIADMDSTIIGQECIDELGRILGIGEDIAAITGRAMAGELDFEAALIERVRLLRGLERARLDEVLEARISLNPGARTLVATMRAHGAATALVSGGFTHFTAPVARRAGFDHHRGNRLLFDGDRLNGEVARPILGRDAKAAALRELRSAAALQQTQTLAVGDGANDLAMLEEAGLGVAYHAKDCVAVAADVRIDACDLSALLYLQGYRQSEFAPVAEGKRQPQAPPVSNA